MACKVLLLVRFAGCDIRRVVICGEEELQPDDCVPCELPDLASSVVVLWELPDLVRCVPDPVVLSACMASRLRRSRLSTHAVG